VRAACIDIGSNTTRLLVADHRAGRLRVVHEERAFTRIGAQLVGADRIGPAKRAEVTAVVEEQLRCARARRATIVRAVATAAIRRATDGERLAEEIRGATGLDVDVLSDREEARLAFVGAAGMLERRPCGPLGVVDVGGGSCEVVVGDAPGEVAWWASLPLGSGTLAARWLVSDPPSAGELDAVRTEVAAAVAPLRPPRPAQAVAVGGSATSLCVLAGPALTPDALGRALATLAAAPSATVARRVGIDPVRARLLPAGLLILQAVAQRLDCGIAAGLGGIREGVLLEAGER
jgi:exopolyphosphatase/guanosine-5'-triphosphate,3'-diphosphate pyrophosphatase